MPLDSLISSMRSRLSAELRPHTLRSRPDQSQGHGAASSTDSPASSSQLSSRLNRIEEALEAMLLSHRAPLGPALNIGGTSSPEGDRLSVLGSPVLGERTDVGSPARSTTGVQREECPGQHTAPSPPGSQVSVARSILHGSTLDRLVMKMRKFRERFDKLQGSENWSNHSTLRFLKNGRVRFRRMASSS